MNSIVTIREDAHIRVLQFGGVLSLGVLTIFSFAGERSTLLIDNTWREPSKQNMYSLESAGSEQRRLFLSPIILGKLSPLHESIAASAARSSHELGDASLRLDLPRMEKENSVAESPVYAPNAPVAWYKFDDNANDSRGTAHGRLRGSPTYSQGVYGKAIRLDGDRDSVQITGAADLFSKIRTGITLAFWQYGATSAHRKDTLCCSDYVNGLCHPAIAINLGCWKQPGEYNWDCGRSGFSSDRLSGKHRDNNEWSGQWNHWAFTKDALSGKMQIFLNGRLFDSRTGAHSLISGITSFEIGSGWYGAYDGLIDDFRIYDYSLSEPEIVYIVNNGIGNFKQSFAALGTSLAIEHQESHSVEGVFEPYTDIEPAQPKGKIFVQEVKSSEAYGIPVSGKITVVASPPAVKGSAAGSSKSSTFVLKPAKETAGSVAPIDKFGMAEFANGEDVVDFDFPETMTLVQLLELAGEYLNLDCVYDPDVVGNQTVTLKLRGSLGGEMKIKDLYTILETVLKFNGLAMTRRGDKLVIVVPVAEVLDADPRLIDGQSKGVQAGDIVVTRMFELRYVDVDSVTNLLQNMKLGVAVSSSDAQILFVTCYAHRMSRIEQLVSMLDRPGRSRECRVRRLQYTVAPALTEKLRTLAQELQGVPVAQAAETGKSTPQQSKGPGGSKAGASGQKVYLDMDERTNRILMIGFEEQLSMLEELIDVLDVAEKDVRTPKAYDIGHMKAQEALDKLQELNVLGPSVLSAGSTPSPGTSYSAKAGRMHGGAPTEEPLVVVLEATNQLLVRATLEQHVLINEFLGHIDVPRKDERILQTYEIQHVEAEQVKRKLEELDIIRLGPAASMGVKPSSGPTGPGAVRSLTISTSGAAEILTEKPRVVVNEATNSLLVTATAEQHAQMAGIIDYVDRKRPEEDRPYRIYPLENSSPAHVADLLKQIIQGTAKKNKEGKIEEAIEREEQITIVPDPNTFSLVVYASREKQEWIANLIEGLDKRRPQVFIDVTLVEITRTDTFEYDLNLVASANDAVIGNIGIEPIHRIDSESRLEGSFNLLDQEGNPSGETMVFYSDQKVQALLSAIQRKNYGRVLAKPKILVDDGQQGDISTTDETTYSKEAIQIPNQGPSITTRDFESIEATIQLQITPHISEGDLVRLDVHLSREDFGTRPAETAPPDKTTSQVTTTVFVPDNHTVILGGLVKLNQSKGGSKVPILGDIPLVGILFRSIENSDLEKKLYVFLKANIVRPYDEAGTVDLQKISEQQQEAFEKSEAEFQKYDDIPGLTPKPVQPERVLEEP